MPTPKVSIVIPVYNVEKYIERCVRTLFAQTLDDLEYIFVDDCSPDNSIDVMLKVLEEYPVRKPQVKLIRHEINQGVSQSRQDGVEAATGEYIIHCDPDDWVELDMYEQLYTKAKETNADLVLCDYYEVTNGEVLTLKKQKPDKLKSEDLLAGITGLYSNKLNGCLWNKIIRKDLYKGKYFINSITFQEDDLVLLNILQKPIKIEYIGVSYYYYRVDRIGSLMKDYSLTNLLKNFVSLEIVNQLMDSNNEQIYKDSCKAWIGAWIVYRAFPCDYISDTDYNRLFSPYASFIKYSSEFGKMKKFIVTQSCKANHNRLLEFNNLLHKIKQYKNGL